MKTRTAIFPLSLLAGASFFTSTALFAQQSSYEITVTNVTKGQTFTPIFAASHVEGGRLFDIGQPAAVEIAALAEDGDTAPLAALAGSVPGIVIDHTTSSGLLPPGDSVTLTLSAEGATSVSVASMLIPTNDTFFAANGVTVPPSGELRVRSPGYDAGSEPNDERCANIPGPVCGGEGGSPNAGGEGFVYINNGIQGIGDLDPAERDWRNPVAEIVIRRVP